MFLSGQNTPSYHIVGTIHVASAGYLNKYKLTIKVTFVGEWIHGNLGLPTKATNPHEQRWFHSI